MIVEEGGKPGVRFRERGGRARREGITGGLNGKVSVLGCLRGARGTCGGVGSGGTPYSP